MKNKGTVKFFAIALAIVSLFHLSFTLKSYLVEKKAERIAKGDPKIEKQYLDSVAFKPVYNLLIKKYTYAECKERELNLGLDLKGGMNVTLEVALDDLIEKLSNNSPDETFQKAVKLSKEKMKNSQKDFVTLFYETYRELAPNGRLSAIFATLENKDEGITVNSTNEQVIAFIRRKAENALGSTFEVLRKRIDKFGVTQPNIQLLENTGRIIVELPGVDEPERVRKLLQGTARLEFWQTYDNKEVYPYFEEVNKVLKTKVSVLNPEGDSTKASAKTDDFFTNVQKADSTKKTAIKDTKASTNKADTSKSLFADGKDTSKKDSSGKLDQNLTKEQYAKEYPLFKVLDPAVYRTEKGGQLLKGPVVGYAFVYDTAKVNNYLTLPEVKAVLPSTIKFAWAAKPMEEKKDVYQLVALKVLKMNKTADLDGSVVTNARVDMSQLGERQVSLSMNSQGAAEWRNLTKNNIGKSIAIVLDGLVYSYPTVQSEIAGGVSQITGRFTDAESKDLANVLNAGKLETQVKIIEEAVVGPSLGKEAINAGLLSILFGFIAVIIFMQFYYNKAGWVANLALISNVFIIMGVLSSLGAVLTLPGIAGLVLTMGMSVDTNVLIYERIREELREGKALRAAVRDGYKMAYSAIIDANATNFLVSLILVIFGSGPIYGFAVVLAIGILTSLFTAIFISRLIFEQFLDKEKKITFGNRITENLFRHINFDFVGARKYAYIFSGITIIIGIISFSTKGFDFGVDFKGGYSFIVRFDKDVHVDKVAESLRLPLGGVPEVKTFGPNNQVKITTSYLINDHSENTTQKVIDQMDKGLSQFKDNKYKVMSVQKVGPTIADDIKKASVRSITFALIIIFLFIFLRFKKWQFGLAAVVCLFHDVFLILTIFSLFKDILPFSLAIDQAIIAALLTNIGYDNHDTIVVYDRIREKLALTKRKPIFALINNAINETMSRSIITSFTVFLVLIVLFLFGGEMIRGFSFALLVGVVVGTLSSIFVATPIVIEFSRRGWKQQHLDIDTETVNA